MANLNVIEAIYREQMSAFNNGKGAVPPFNGATPCFYCEFAYSERLKAENVNACEYCIHNPDSLLYTRAVMLGVGGIVKGTKE